MSLPESIPEDREPAFPCNCGGSVTLVNGVWECDSCNFSESD